MTKKQKTQRQAILSTAHFEYQIGLNKYAFFKTSDHEVGKDLVQVTFMKTWSYLAKGGKIETMKAFLYHILNNLIVDEYRKRKTSSLDSMIENGFDPRASGHKRLLNIIDGKNAFLLIKHLPKKYQKVMRMRYVKELSLKEISHSTQQRKNTIAVQIHRGLGKLRVLYNPLTLELNLKP